VSVSRSASASASADTGGGVGAVTGRRASSLFTMKTEQLRASLVQFIDFSKLCFDEFAAYHQDLPWYRSNIDIIFFEETSSRLVVDIAAELKELQSLKLKHGQSAQNKHALDHYTNIITSLCDLLQNVSGVLDTMKQERQKYNMSPFRLHTDLTDISVSQAVSKSEITVSLPLESSVKNGVDVSSKFSDRYVSEVALPKQMDKYQQFYDDHKELLVNENKELNEKFSEELDEAQNIERSVQSIAYLLNDFSRILEQQSDGVEEVHTDSRATSAFVREADAELSLTIERSKSSQRNMVFVTVGLALLLLLLDYFTP
jgi:hypothetical protein